MDVVGGKRYVVVDNPYRSEKIEIGIEIGIEIEMEIEMEIEIEIDWPQRRSVDPSYLRASEVTACV